MKSYKLFINFIKYAPALFKIIYKTDRKYFFLKLIFCILDTVIIYPPMMLIKITIDLLTTGESFYLYLRYALILITITGLIDFGIKYIDNYSYHVRKEYFDNKIRQDFFLKCMSIDYALLAEKELQEKREIASTFIMYGIDNALYEIISIIKLIINLIISIIVIVQINAVFIVIILACISFNNLLKLIFISRDHNLNDKIIKEKRVYDYFKNTSLSFSYAKEIRIFNIHDFFINKLSASFHSILKYTKKRQFIADFPNILLNISNISLQVIIYILLGRLVIIESISIGEFSFTLGIIQSFQSSILDFFGTLINFTNNGKYADEYISFMAIKNGFAQGKQELLKNIITDNYKIEFKNVSFKYPQQDTYALNKVNAIFSNREKICLVGENGSGKSTFIKLLCRLYDPCEGEILLNNVNIKDIDYSQYISLFSAIFQDYKLFAFKIGENISSLSAKPIKENIIKAATLAGINDKIQNLEEQYDNFLFNLYEINGINLSGGEEQKLAIARARYKPDASIILLDEPTAALDPRSEYLLYKQFREFTNDYTAFYISHRLSSAKLCNKIILLSDGTVKATGTHKEMMEKCESYSEMYNLQASYYKD